MCDLHSLIDPILEQCDSIDPQVLFRECLITTNGRCNPYQVEQLILEYLNEMDLEKTTIK